MAVRLLSAEDVFWALLLLLFPIIAWRKLSTLQTRKPPEVRSVTIVVLGDIGRSPRMMYHAESFARAGYETTIVGYNETTPPSMLNGPGIQFFYLPPPLRIPRKLFVLLAPIKVSLQVVSLMYAVLIGRHPHRPPQYILVQNPPSIPTLAVVQFVAWLRGSKLIIDWHNLGYSILALKLGDEHILVKISAWFERTFGRKAYAHLFVTNAMKNHLIKKWDLRGRTVVLHDRPPARFHSASETEAHELFHRLPDFCPTIENFFPPPSPSGSSTFRTELTTSFGVPGGSFPSELAPVAVLRQDRPALVISSTSWTSDEDFGILIDALHSYEHKARATLTPSKLPKILMIVTGKGPLRQAYMERVLKLESEDEWQLVRCRSLWVEAPDYPLLLGELAAYMLAGSSRMTVRWFLGSADLGVSLHSSSSKLDLPMKVVDMFGCGLPVCALDFACLDELVVDGQNGLVFKSAVELADQFERLLSGFPSSAELDRLRSSLRKPQGQNPPASWCTWEENWKNIVQPLLDIHLT